MSLNLSVVPVNTLVTIGAVNPCAAPSAQSTIITIGADPVSTAVTAIPNGQLTNVVLSKAGAASGSPLINGDSVNVLSIFNNAFALALVPTGVYGIAWTSQTASTLPPQWRVVSAAVPNGAPVPTSTVFDLISTSNPNHKLGINAANQVVQVPILGSSPCSYKFFFAGPTTTYVPPWVTVLYPGYMFSQGWFNWWVGPNNWNPVWPRPQGCPPGYYNCHGMCLPMGQPCGGVPGGDVDIHGCKPSTGYSWCPTTRSCIAPGSTCPPPPGPKPGPDVLPIIGGDVDIHGCKPSAGYHWCPTTNSCIGPGQQCLLGGGGQQHLFGPGGQHLVNPSGAPSPSLLGPGGTRTLLGRRTSGLVQVHNTYGRMY